MDVELEQFNKLYEKLSTTKDFAALEKFVLANLEVLSKQKTVLDKLLNLAKDLGDQGQVAWLSIVPKIAGSFIKSGIFTVDHLVGIKGYLPSESEPLKIIETLIDANIDLLAAKASFNAALFEYIPEGYSRVERQEFVIKIVAKHIDKLLTAEEGIVRRPDAPTIHRELFNIAEYNEKGFDFVATLFREKGAAIIASPKLKGGAIFNLSSKEAGPEIINFIGDTIHRYIDIFVQKKGFSTTLFCMLKDGEQAKSLVLSIISKYNDLIVKAESSIEYPSMFESTYHDRIFDLAKAGEAGLKLLSTILERNIDNSISSLTTIKTAIKFFIKQGSTTPEVLKNIVKLRLEDHRDQLSDPKAYLGQETITYLREQLGFVIAAPAPEVVALTVAASAVPTTKMEVGVDDLPVVPQAKIEVGASKSSWHVTKKLSASALPTFAQYLEERYGDNDGSKDANRQSFQKLNELFDGVIAKSTTVDELIKYFSIEYPFSYQESALRFFSLFEHFKDSADTIRTLTDFIASEYYGARGLIEESFEVVAKFGEIAIPALSKTLSQVKLAKENIGYLFKLLDFGKLGEVTFCQQLEQMHGETAILNDDAIINHLFSLAKTSDDITNSLATLIGKGKYHDSYIWGDEAMLKAAKKLEHIFRFEKEFGDKGLRLIGQMLDSSDNAWEIANRDSWYEKFNGLRYSHNSQELDIFKKLAVKYGFEIYRDRLDKLFFIPFAHGGGCDLFAEIIINSKDKFFGKYYDKSSDFLAKLVDLFSCVEPGFVEMTRKIFTATDKNLYDPWALLKIGISLGDKETIKQGLVKFKDVDSLELNNLFLLIEEILKIPADKISHDRELASVISEILKISNQTYPFESCLTEPKLNELQTKFGFVPTYQKLIVGELGDSLVERFVKKILVPQDFTPAKKASLQAKLVEGLTIITSDPLIKNLLEVSIETPIYLLNTKKVGFKGVFNSTAKKINCMFESLKEDADYLASFFNTLVHESTHAALETLYNNKRNPFSIEDVDAAKHLESVKKMIMQKYEADGISSMLTLYAPEKQILELPTFFTGRIAEKLYLSYKKLPTTSSTEDLLLEFLPLVKVMESINRHAEKHIALKNELSVFAGLDEAGGIALGTIMDYASDYIHDEFLPVSSATCQSVEIAGGYEDLVAV